MPEPRLTLSPGITWEYEEDSLRVYGDSLLLVEGCPPRITALLGTLASSGMTEAELAAAAASRDQDMRGARKVVDILRHTGVIVRKPARDWAGTPVERQVGYLAAVGVDADVAQELLHRAHVTILGLGGIGCVVLSHLVSAGVQNFNLIDHDDVHIDNFNRQYLFTRADLGRSKAEAARDWVLGRAPEARVDVFRARITARSQLIPRLAGIAALVLAADEPHGAIPLIAAEACLAAETALISASCGLRTGSYGPLVPPEKLPDYIKQLTSNKLSAAPAPMLASFGPTNTITAAYAALELIHWLAGISPGTPEQVILRFGPSANSPRV